jgi:hypothetical protein
MQSMLLMYADVSKVPGRELEAAAARKDEPCQQA